MPEARGMDHHDRSPCVEISQKLQPTIEALFEASKYAVDTHSEAWDFAIPIRRLLKLGATETDLRWLVRKGFVEHAREVTVEGDDGREFRPTGNLTFCRRTCVVLTEVGFSSAQSDCNQLNNGHKIPASNSGKVDHKLPMTSPRWDVGLRKLQLGETLIKQFKWPALNQESVLCAFQEEDWPERIDDPLPPQPEQDPKRRLADTIKCLNRKQMNELIRFRGDGTGEGVVWERIDTGR